MNENARAEVLYKLAGNLKLAHQSLFAHRHPQATPDFHWQMIEDWHSPHPRVAEQAFRGGAKSSIGEEGCVIGASFKMFKNALILGDTAERATDRLRAIKHEFETNEGLEAMFGKQVGPIWRETKIVLANGVVLQCYSRGQSLRGVKHNDVRPDFVFADDIENEESCASEEQIAKTMQWLLAVVIPALDINAKIRVKGTPLHPRAMICQLDADPNWLSRIYPIEVVDEETGKKKPIWAARYPQKWIDERRDMYARHGHFNHFAQEYLCKAEDPQQKTFTASMFHVEQTVRTWQPCYAMIDPARTVKDTSASTGLAVWSWIGRRLVIWEAQAGLWKPDEIVSQIFRVDEEYRPIVIGVERDGLEEFILQPLRHEQLRRGYAVPIRDMKAPRGKIDFIRALQPFFKAKEVIFARNCPDAMAQFLSFPTGRIDVPNALAYALMLRPGQPIYDTFGTQNVGEDLPTVARSPVYLALNATPQCTAAALIQMADGGLTVLQDWVREGDPGYNLDPILREAGLAGGGKPKVFVPPHHFGAYDTIGLKAAARAIPIEILRGGVGTSGREELRMILNRMARGRPAVMVSTAARWTLNAFSGGYCREVTKHGMLTEQAVEGPYRVLMEGIESLSALTKSATLRDDDAINYGYTRDGRRFISSRATHHG